MSPPPPGPRWLVVVGALPDPQPARVPLRAALGATMNDHDADGTGPDAFDTETAGRHRAPEER